MSNCYLSISSTCQRQKMSFYAVIAKFFMDKRFTDGSKVRMNLELFRIDVRNSVCSL
jgi:hypothetical protein